MLSVIIPRKMGSYEQARRTINCYASNAAAGGASHVTSLLLPTSYECTHYPNNIFKLSQPFINIYIYLNFNIRYMKHIRLYYNYIVINVWLYIYVYSYTWRQLFFVFHTFKLFWSLLSKLNPLKPAISRLVLLEYNITYVRTSVIVCNSKQR